MAVSAGDLDALVGVTGAVSELYGITFAGGTSSGTLANEVVGSATVETTGAAAPGTAAGVGETFAITAVNDATDTATFVFSVNGGADATFTEYVLAFDSDGFLFSASPPFGVALSLDQNAFNLINGIVGVFSPSVLATGTTLTFTNTGTDTASLVPLTPVTPFTPSTPVTPTTPSAPVTLLPTQASVTGAGGTTLILNFATSGLASQAQTELTAISAAIAMGDVGAESVTGGNLPTLPAGGFGLAEIDGGGDVNILANYEAVIDLANNPVSLISAAAGSQLVIASGTGDVTYAAESGAETVYGGAGAMLAFGGAASLDFFCGTGAATIIGGGGGNSVAGGAGTQLIFGASSLSYAGGAGAATIIGGGQGNTITGGSGNLLLFGSGAMTYTGNGGAATVIGGGGPLVASLGSGGGVAYGSPNGGNALSTSGSSASVLVGGGSGDVLTATGSGADVLVAGAGAETINGSAATGNLVIFGGSGSDVLAGGSGNDLFLIEPGNETLTGGGGSNTYVFIDFGTTARTDIITDFNPAKDAIGLFGFGAEPGADAAALASATISAGNTVVTLVDGTRIIFTGAPVPQASDFF
jgi:Ca2+-binding RTX toxin-like protein